MHHLFYSFVGMRDGLLVLDNGAFFWVNFIFTYLLIMFGTCQLVQLYIKSPTIYRNQAGLLIGATLVPLGANFFYVFDLLPVKYFDITPMAFFLSGLLCYYSLFRYKFLDIIPVAREKLFESINDPVIVIDHSGRIVDLNKKALELVVTNETQDLSDGIVGKSFQIIFSSWPELGSIVEEDGDMQTRCTHSNEGIIKYYHIRISGINGVAGIPGGKIIVLRDITEIEIAFQMVRDSRKALHENNLQLAEANRTLKEKSITDSLTGIYNHEFIINMLESYIQKTGPEKMRLSLIMLDLDYFKNINDRYGHLTGDRVLREVSQSIRNSIRINDHVGRYGGEEFLVILPRTEIKECRVIAERIRYNLEKIDFPEKGLVVTASLGLAEYNGEEISEFIHRADLNLLKTKNKGRNTIEG
jgi:diguanylate cyclase (GGDEF)-like protein